MQKHEEEKQPPAPRLNLEDQQAVLMLATRLQQEREEGASLDDLIAIGQEAGLSREAVEEAYHRIASSPTEKVEREKMGRALGNEIAAVQLTTLWILATWAGVMVLPVNEIVGVLGVVSTFLLVPTFIGLLVRRPMVAASLGAAIALNMIIAFTVRFGVPTNAGARSDFLVFVVPVVLALAVSAGANLFSGRQKKVGSIKQDH